MFAGRTKTQDSLRGLSQAEVEQARKQYGENRITKRKRRGFLAQYLASFSDPIIKILLIALAINVIFLFRRTSWYESAGIAVAVLIATFVSTLSEYGSEAAFEKLQAESEQLMSRVKRSGRVGLLPASELVVGDVVLLQSGEKIPADGHLAAGSLSVDQSALNGESREAHKSRGAPAADDDLSSPAALFRGSVIYNGEGVMVVDRVGDRTLYGKLALEVQQDTVESPLRVRLQKLADTISRLGYTAAAVVAAASLFNSFVLDSGFSPAVMQTRLSDTAFVLKTLMDALILAISVLVMAVPEGLPMMITVVLSANMKKMLKDNVLVRKLVGIETAGSLNILFTDKTGTLTRGRLRVTRFVGGDGAVYETESALRRAPVLWQSVMRGCLYNSDAQVSGSGRRRRAIGGNGTDRALLSYALAADRAPEEAALLAREAFDSAKKYAASQISCRGRTLFLVKGTPEIVVPACSAYLDADGNRKPLYPGALRREMREMGGKAIRMLALAEGPARFMPGRSQDLTLVGLFGIRDEIRRQARPAIAEITSAGIQTVMITGDNRETAVAIAREIGLLYGDTDAAVCTSGELARMSDSEVRERLCSLRVVARAMPADKSRLVRLSQEMGLVAGMTGDGINDAPALKKADVGFAMGAGTEVAKEAGDIVITDNNISSICRAILYGRTIFKSIRKFIVYQLTMNFCAVTLSVICPFLGIDAPLTVMQMLWLNMIMDTLAGLAFSGEAPLREYMREPPKRRDEKIINSYMYGQILCAGLYMTAMCLLFLKLPVTQRLFHYQDGSNYFMTAFFALFIFAGVLNSLNVRTYRINLFSGLLSNRIFLGAMLLVCAVQVLLIFVGGDAFRTTALRIPHLRTILLLAATVLPVDLLRKIWYRRTGKKRCL